MNEPVTTLDQRYSDPAVTATPWEQTRRALETAELFWYVTVRADGRPHATPVVAVWDDGAIYFTTGAEEQKFRNLRSNPRVLLMAGSTHWNEGLDVVVEGDAVQVTDDEVLTRLAQVWTSKWDGRWQFHARNGVYRDEGQEEGGPSCSRSRPPKSSPTPRATPSATPVTSPEPVLNRFRTGSDSRLEQSLIPCRTGE